MKKTNLKLVACLPLAAILVGCGRTTIDPNEYVEVKYEGMDSVARAYVEIDYEKMVTDNLKAFGIKSKKDDHDIERSFLSGTTMTLISWKRSTRSSSR